jgi:hypothetical protein
LSGPLLHFIWENDVSDFIDTLVEMDIRYLAVQRAIERVIEVGIILEYSQPILVDNDVVYLHHVPVFFREMIPLIVIFHYDEKGIVTVLKLEILF